MVIFLRYLKIYKITQEFEQWLSLKTSKKIPSRKQIVKWFIDQQIPIQILGRGAYKSCFLIQSQKKFLVLKVGQAIYIERDVKVINTARTTPLRPNIARYYWQTPHCALQKYIAGTAHNEEVILKLKIKAKQYGFTDIRKANIGTTIKGQHKIFDCSLR